VSSVLFFRPNLTGADLDMLRGGQTLADKNIVGLTFTYRDGKDLDSAGNPRLKTGTLDLVVRDYASAPALFFGDRALKDPGYSEFTLKGTVGVNGADNDTLDVYRVEQRLKYLGFPAMGEGRSTTVRTPQDFEVDGKWGVEEAKAAWLFARVVNYAKPGAISTAAGTAGSKQLVNANRGPGLNFSSSLYASQLTTASNGFVVNKGDAGVGVLNWLKAWNAPHWVNVGQFATRSARWVNTQTEATLNLQENWGSSWMGDWLVAQQFAPAGPQTSFQMLFNGATDANHAQTPSDHSSHDLGMAFDVGIAPRPGQANTTAIAPVAREITTSGSPLNYQMNQAADNATPTGRQLSLPPGFTQGWSDANAAWFVRPDARTAFPVPGSTNGQTTTIRGAATIEGTDPNLPISATNPGVYRLPTGTWVGNRVNDERGVTAEILSLYSITQKTSAGYTATRSRLTGTDGEKATKAEFLFSGIFGSVFIGNSTEQYKNIRYVLRKLGIEASNQPHHEHHFHVTMAVPTLKKITKSDTSTNLLATEAEEASEMNTGLPVDEAMVVAQATPPAIMAPAPNWLGDSPPAFTDALLASIRQGTSFGNYEYSGNGPNGMPVLTVKAFVPFYGARNESNVGYWQFAAVACACLDREANQAGAWGPECKIEKIVKAPRGALSEVISPRHLPGSYLYTPRKIGTDRFTFILENGAGKKVEVTYVLNVTRFYPEQDSSVPQDEFIGAYGGDLDAWFASSQLSALLAGGSQPVFGFGSLDGAALAQTLEGPDAARITFDWTAAGHGWFIDTTPDEQAEFLPTADSTVWKARPGWACCSPG